MVRQSLDNNYINNEDFNSIHNKALKISKSISNLIQHLKKSQFNGSKYTPLNLEP